MKLAIYTPDGGVQLFDLEETESAYFQGSGMHPGYTVKVDDWEKIPGAGGESIVMSLYEGAESCGSYPDSTNDDYNKLGWSWAVLPETVEESEHLRGICPRVGFHNFGHYKNEEATEARDQPRDDQSDSGG